MRKVIINIICLFLILSITSIVTFAAESEWSVESVTWQDPNNAVLIWKASEGSIYRIYRVDEIDGDYTYIGQTSAGSYRDDTAKYPGTYYYKVERLLSGEESGKFSKPIASGTNPQKISSVAVIMYHNFIRVY